MNDPRATTALRHLPLDPAPHGRLAWFTVAPDPSERVQLPAAVADRLEPGLVRTRAPLRRRVDLAVERAPERRVGVDQRGRLYVPAWLRRPALVVLSDPAAGVLALADVSVLDAVGERLLRAVRA